jgi:hypothetical protein
MTCCAGFTLLAISALRWLASPSTGASGHLDAQAQRKQLKSRLQIIDGGLQLLVRFPVEIRSASRVSRQVTDVVLKLIEGDESVRKAVTGLPILKAARAKARLSSSSIRLLDRFRTDMLILVGGPLSNAAIST